LRQDSSTDSLVATRNKLAQKPIFPIIVFVRTCGIVIHDERWAAHIDRTNFFNSSSWGKCIREF